MEEVAVIMQVASGRGEDSQWFDYRPSYFGDVIRVEWEMNTDRAKLPRDVADYLIRNNYARLDPEPPKETEPLVETTTTTTAEPPTVAAEETPPPPPPKDPEPPPPPPSGKRKDKSK